MIKLLKCFDIGVKRKIIMSIKVALTGATGAMGGEVLYHLLQSERNIEIRCIIYDGEKKLPKFFKKTVKANKGKVERFKGDIANYADCVKLIAGCDYVFHCAALIPPKSDHDPEGTYLTDFLGTKNLIDAVKASGRADKIKFVHVATVAMYGNRSYPHVWGRVGDPIISSDYDCYSENKLKAEKYLLESGLPHFVSLRQTAVLHKYMFANNLKDGLMFHTSWNCPLEWVTDEDSGRLCRNLVERDLDGKLEGFWNDIYNIGGGAACRVTGFETLDGGFKIMGKGAKKFFKPNWNIARNFHGVWFYDSDRLENFLHFRTQTFDDFWRATLKKHPYFKLGKIVPAKLISSLLIKRLFKNTNAPMYWLKHGKEGRVKAFFGGREQYEKIAADWKDYPLLCEGNLPDGKIDYEKLRDVESAEKYLLEHGYDESVPIAKLTVEQLDDAAKFRGGRLLSETYCGDPHEKLKWRCAEGHEFTLSPFTVLRGGYFCPDCEPKPWRYGAVAKRSPFIAQVYFDTHTDGETDDVYPLSADEDKFIVKK